MDTNRVLQIVLSELSLENLKLQEKLESAVNSNSEIDMKVSNLQTIITQLAISDLKIAKYQPMLQQQQNNNQQQNTEQNG